jgi:LacI family transcriptional regulator
VAVTLRDVAQEAGVSTKTVSRVVNHQGEISEATRLRVTGAIERLGYRPSKVARALVTQRTDTIGLVLGDITNPFFPEVARGILDVAEPLGYSVFLCHSDGDHHREVRSLHSLADHAVDGIIIFPTYELEEILDQVAVAGRPLVSVNRPLNSPWASSVMIHSYRGGRMAVEHLLARQHRNIAMLAGPTADAHRLRRTKGYRDALLEHDVPVREEWILPGAPIHARGRESARELLLRYPEITAIVAYNDLLALGALQACNELGRRVPNDCAIIGFDDIPLADSISPALTTVRVHKYELGQQAMNRLLQMRAEPGIAFEPIWMDVELVVRQSA